MQVEVTCRHGSISNDVRSRIVQKSEKLLTFLERVSAIGVTVDFAGDRVKVEILVDTEHKQSFVSSDEGDSAVTPVFESALNKMEQQIRRYKEKLQDHRRDPGTAEFAKAETQRDDD